MISAFPSGLVSAARGQARIDRMHPPVRLRVSLVWLTCAVMVVLPADTSVGAQPGGPETTAGDFMMRVGFTADEAARARGGQPVVRVLPGSVPSEVAVAGAIRIHGDIERLVIWLRDIEDFRRALGSDAVGAIDSPARLENFGPVNAADLDLAELERCAAGECAIQLPAAFSTRLREVPWGEADAASRAGTVVRQLLAEYAATYQSGGDRAVGSLHDQQQPLAIAAAFQDMLRRAAPVWQLAYELAAYLEEFPARQPVGVEDRFYWTRESGDRKPIATLHHVVLQRLPDRSLRLADKQFYASRDLDAALLIGQATPSPDGQAFDLVLSVRARVPRAGSAAGRLLRERVNRELAETFSGYLEWLQRSFALP